MVDMAGITIWPVDYACRVVVEQARSGRPNREAVLAYDRYNKEWQVVNDESTPFPAQWDAICYVVERWRRWDAEDAEAADALARADKALSKSSPRAALRRGGLEP